MKWPVAHCSDLPLLGLLAGMEELDLVDLRLSAPALTALYKSFSSSRCTMLTRLALNLINFESQVSVLDAISVY